MHGELRRNLQPGVGVSFADLARDRLDALHFANDAERLRVNEAIDELTALDRAILVKDDERHVFHVGVERVTKRDHFHQRREKHEEQRHRVAPDDDEFLEQDSAETAKGGMFLHVDLATQVKTPNSKHQTPGKLQSPRTNVHAWFLKIGIS